MAVTLNQRVSRLAKIAYVVVMLGMACWVAYRLSAPGRWSSRAYEDLAVMVVDYTVPFDNYREHVGLFWLLNHRKIRPPGSPRMAADEGRPWELSRDYVGYKPSDRDHPERVGLVDRSHAQLIYLTDTYGVYRDDLKHTDSRVAHMDYTTLVFGGLSDGDVHALSDFAAHGGELIAEFNTFCDPTSPEARAHIAPVFGVEWTDWVGRVFADPYDESDVPHWLPREYGRQYPGRELPHSPILLLIARDGRLAVFGGPSLGDVAPRIMMTQSGKKRFPAAAGDVPYYFWFSIMRARPGAAVQARLRMPKLAGLSDLVARIDADAEPPAFVEQARAHYFVGDFADLDFDPGPYDSDAALTDGAKHVSALSSMTAAPAFWRFYAPVMDQLLREAEARAHKH